MSGKNVSKWNKQGWIAKIIITCKYSQVCHCSSTVEAAIIVTSLSLRTYTEVFGSTGSFGVAILSIIPGNQLLWAFLVQNFNLGIAKMSIIPKNPLFPKTSVSHHNTYSISFNIHSHPVITNPDEPNSRLL